MIGDRKFTVHHDGQEVKTVAFQNHLQFPGIKLAKRSVSFNALHRISKPQDSQFGTLFAGKTIGIAVIWKEPQIY